jgi:translation initiation factor IF-3
MRGHKKYKSSNNPGLRLRINDRIKAGKVRLIGLDGEQIGIVATSIALAQAKEHGLDLIEIAPGAKPPVCKIADFGKMRYEHSKKQKQQLKKKSQSIVKMVKMSPVIGGNDLLRKIVDAQKFLDKGYKVTILVEMRGRQNKHPDLAFRLAETVKEKLDADVFERIVKQGNRVSMAASQSSKFEKKADREAKEREDREKEVKPDSEATPSG